MTGTDRVPERIVEATEVQESCIGPPSATIARRAQSYSDFHDAVVAHVRKERKSVKRKKSLDDRQEPEGVLQSAIDYATWSFDLEDELLDASHEEYQYDPTWTPCKVLVLTDDAIGFIRSSYDYLRTISTHCLRAPTLHWASCPPFPNPFEL